MPTQTQLPMIQKAIGTSIKSWKILAYAGVKFRKHKVWCLCSCGNVRKIYWWALKDGESKDCGCTSRVGRLKHGHSKNPTPEYICWSSMMARSGQKRSADSYHDKTYRDRGIFVCDRWESFENFFSDMGLRPSPVHSIDRIDNDKGYFPENCRWATPKEQNRNMRKNKPIEFNGESHIIPDWAKITGIHQETIKSRLRTGWSVEHALTVPPNGKPVRAGMFSVN